MGTVISFQQETALPFEQQDCVKIILHFYDDEERPLSEIYQQVERATRRVRAKITQPMRPHQEQALVSLVADLEGSWAFGRSETFESSRLVEAINNKQVQIAASEFFRFVYLNGLVSQRLWEKRNSEQLLFRKGTLILR